MDFRRLDTAEDVQIIIAHHNANSNVVSIDTETTGLDPFSDQITDVVISGRTPDSAVAFGPEHIPLLNGLRKDLRLVLHNFKFDYKMLRKAGWDFREHPVTDTMLLHHLVDEEASHGLDGLVQHYYQDNYKEVFWNTYKEFTAAPADAALEYMCKDAIYTKLLESRLMLELSEQGIPLSLVEHVHSLAWALLDTEVQGIGIDQDYLLGLATELKPAILRYRQDMRDAVDTECQLIELDLWREQIDKLYSPRGKKWQTLPKPEFNFSSHTQLGQLLYDKLKLPEQLNQKTKRRSVDDEALSRLEHLHPVVKMLRQHAEYQKVYTAFIEGTLERQRDGRIYPSFNVNGTVTGRISSSDPNLQQLPAKGDWAKVRGIYVPDPGHSIITCDYGQLEVVIAAHFSHDPNLLKIVNEGASKHDITAESLKIERPLAKTINFAMQYQCSSKKIQQLVGCSVGEAEYIWNKYWETYAGERRVIEECKAKVDQGQPIVNPFGRRRHFKQSFETRWAREAAYRQAYASLVQGTGSDCTHYAFYTVARELKRRGLGRALFEVHDEIVISADTARAAEAQELLKVTMVEAGRVANLTLPLSVDCSDPLVRWAK